jgi:hypothetical protein
MENIKLSGKSIQMERFHFMWKYHLIVKQYFSLPDYPEEILCQAGVHEINYSPKKDYEAFMIGILFWKILQKIQRR